MSFNVVPRQRRGTVAVKVYVPDPVPNAYYKYDPDTDVWLDYTGSVVFEGPRHNGRDATDGGSGDHDGLVNGEIVDGGRLAVVQDDCKKGGWGTSASVQGRAASASSTYRSGQVPTQR
jgi:hypothetical protein